jgi:hypothetical protein
MRIPAGNSTGDTGGIMASDGIKDRKDTSQEASKRHAANKARTD